MEKLTLVKIAEMVNGQLFCRDNDMEKTVSGVSIDSRENLNNKLFVPLKGERTDGHLYIQKAYENGAVCALSEVSTDINMPYIKVDSTYRALKELALKYKEMLDVRIVAVTGSVGKTSTKDLIHSVLSQKFNTLKTEGNLNNEIGLPLTVFNLNKKTQYAVLEMGMSNFGEISELSRIVKPDVCVITNIGISHIEFLGSREGILKAKTEIFDYMKKYGTIILNGDCDMLSTLKKTYPKAIFYGIDKSNIIHAGDINPEKSYHTIFNIIKKDISFRVNMPFPGEHMVSNALAAAAVGFCEGLSPAEIKNGIQCASLSKMRMDIKTTESGIKVFNDVYNSSPQSVKAAADILEMEKGRKIAIIGDMLELGDFSRKAHEEVGEYVASKNIDLFIFIGPHSIHSFNAVKEKHGDNCCYYYTNKEKAISELGGILNSGDSVLVKASRGMGFEKIVQEIFEVKK